MLSVTPLYLFCYNPVSSFTLTFLMLQYSGKALFSWSVRERSKPFRYVLSFSVFSLRSISILILHPDTGRR